MAGPGEISPTSSHADKSKGNEVVSIFSLSKSMGALVNFLGRDHCRVLLRCGDIKGPFRRATTLVRALSGKLTTLEPGKWPQERLCIEILISTKCVCVCVGGGY